jgi:hypothetical protein
MLLLGSNGALLRVVEKISIFRLISITLLKIIYMALIPNNKKKKDGKQPAAAKSNIPGFPAGKGGGKTNSKGAMKNTRLTGGSQRGS